ncbi:VOC family protein [Streptomyces sp. NPDC048734]|uniref:VOC family protein n=1 Tax=Streptomyces sp. NPDC048734 TaxID=3365590 RepID=UPI00371AFE21
MVVAVHREEAGPWRLRPDLDVPGLGTAQEQVLAPGTTLLRVVTRARRFLADPAGHSFRLLQGWRGRPVEALAVAAEPKGRPRATLGREPRRMPR